MQIFLKHKHIGTFQGSTMFLSKDSLITHNGTDYVIEEVSKDRIDVDYTKSYYVSQEIRDLKKNIKDLKQRLNQERYDIIKSETETSIELLEIKLKELESRKYLRTKKDCLKAIMSDEVVYYDYRGNTFKYMFLNDDIVTMYHFNEDEYDIKLGYIESVDFNSIKRYSECYTKERII